MAADDFRDYMLLFKTNDHFWFTFFHEAKHVLQQRKKTIFLEGEQAESADTVREEEANRFASELLIQSAEFDRFVAATSRFSSADVCRFAESVGIHPGVVSGRLLREGYLDYKEPAAKLRVKFAWK
ncbi:MAG: ImmA/IrrE family metallo-endopeptidase [Verrucomicrobia bacterium]|jgi:Zn-dependent peptidase ImmA (M78 family)|nr:ImmA/IrrE family metallo-endopeptidase [Verrucomicrobiota bacterium]